MVITAGSCRMRTEPSDPADRILTRSCDFLWSSQSDDGGWHSATHGLMHGGEATTAFVLSALLGAGPGCRVDTAAKSRALDFLRAHVDGRGIVGLSDPDIIDYPNYATAYTLGILARHGSSGDSVLVRKMRDYLLSEQFDEDRGIDSTHPAYGGWGFGETILPAGSVGHVDLSQTRRVLEALRIAGSDGTAAGGMTDAFRKSQVFLALLQKQPEDPRVRIAGGSEAHFDGGFFASSVIPVVNKSIPITDGEGIYLFSSYATATADGLLALVATGLDRQSQPVGAAYDWLTRHPDFAYPAGIPRDDLTGWGRVMFFYHVMVRCEAYRRIGAPGNWRKDVAVILAGRQDADGSFSNPMGAPNKEDDPLIATAMVVTALSPPQPEG